MKSRVVIVTVNWRGARDTADCLRSLAGQAFDDWSVVVVDNGSGDDSIAQLSQVMAELADASGHNWQLLSSQQAKAPPTGRLPRYTLVDAAANLGFAAANNVGIALGLAASNAADHFWILNNDVEVDPRALAELVARSQTGRYSVVGSLLVYHDDRSRIQCVGGVRFDSIKVRGEQIGQDSHWDGHTPPAEPQDISYVAGASMLVPAQAIRQVGAMEEKYFLYYEELDWMARLRQYGPAAVATRSVVFHKEGASIGTSSRALRSLRSQYYLSRNLLLVYAKTLPAKLPLAVLRNAREAMRFARLHEWSHLRVVLRATWHGLCGRGGKAVDL